MPKKSNLKRAAVVAAAASLVTGAIVSSTGASASTASSKPNYVRVCAVAKPGFAACNALRSLRSRFQPNVATALPDGYGPADLQSAYNLAAAAAAKGGTQTVALVDAYDDPTAESDLAVYRSTYSLPPCTSASGCFAKVPGSGSTLPATNASWAQEESLDVDMVSAVCPNCKIRLVEALSNSTANLATAVKTAATTVGATEISNSYGGSESSSDPTTAKNDYSFPGVVITASNGDSGYGVEFPAAAPSVLAVGGTSLSRASNARGWTETVWGHGSSSRILGGTGSGCSKYEAKPSWQHDTGCSKRMVGDISADADPNTGVAVYDTTAYEGSSGWLVFGGTSVASPIIASVAALSGQAAAHPTLQAGAYLYASNGGAAHVYDVTSGSNGTCTGSPAYFCNGETGYDGPTGLGTPNGNAAVL